jgi:hypothetical protein
MKAIYKLKIVVEEKKKKKVGRQGQIVGFANRMHFFLFRQ